MDILTITTSDNRPKYEALCKLATICLSMPHGNADVERGFSENKRILTDSRTSMVLGTLRGIRWIRDYLFFNDPGGGRPVKYPISANLISAFSSSRSTYQLYLEETTQEAQAKANKEKAEGEERRAVKLAYNNLK